METYSVIYQGVNLEVTGTFYPGTPMVMYYSDGTGHPGDPPEINIVKITLEDSDVNLMDLIDECVIETIEDILCVRLDEEYGE